MPVRTEIMNSKEAVMKLNRIAYEMVENNLDEGEIILAGIVDRGVQLAKLLKKQIEQISQLKVTIISITIDKQNPIDASIDEPFSAEGKTVIIIDDVANSGKTALYAIRLFLNTHPRKIQVAVLVDRKHKLFPISSDYIGLMLSTNLQEHIHVEIKQGKVSSAYLE